ncbi:MAG: AAA family ATPase [Alphaproteobacteria bacterium]
MENPDFTNFFNNAEPFTGRSKLELINMDDVEMIPIKWLWKNRIALGKLSIIAGQPGLGKSQITSMLCTHITAQKPFPDGFIGEKGDVLIISAEDDVQDTIKPRLIAAGADVRRCHFLDGVHVRGEEKDTFRMFDLEQDIKPLEDTVEALPDLRLIIIDPVSAYQGNTDSHNNAEIRGLLAPYQKLAAKHSIALVLVTHFNKSNSQEPLERIIGSIGLIAAARGGYAVVKDQDDETLRHFVPVKNNIGDDKTGFSYRIEGMTLDNGIETSKIVWGNIPVQAHKILYPEKKTQTNGAKDFLAELLSGGAKPVSEILDEAEGMGYKIGTIQRAAGNLGVKKSKLGMEGGWQWSLEECT